MMAPNAPTDSNDFSPAPKVGGKRHRVRRDIISGESLPEIELIRLAIAPDGTVLPDLGMKLPGRGVWVRAEREAVETAMAKGHIARSAKRKVSVPDNLAEIIAGGLRDRLLSMVGMAKRSGVLVTGFDSVKTALHAEEPSFRIAASESSRDGRNKLRVISKAIWDPKPVIGCFNASELGRAVGLDDFTHGLVRKSKMGRSFTDAALRYSGFAPIIPGEWSEEIEDFEAWKSATMAQFQAQN